MDESSKRSQHLFIVRLWEEGGAQPAGQWRGSVEHVPTGKRLYFTSLADLNDFITLSLRGPSTLDADASSHPSKEILQ